MKYLYSSLLLMFSLFIFFPDISHSADTIYVLTKDNVVEHLVIPQGREDLIKPEWGYDNLIDKTIMVEVPAVGWLFTTPNRYDNPNPPAGYSEEYIVGDVRTLVPIGTIPTAGVGEKAEFVDGTWIIKYEYLGAYVTLDEARELKRSEIDTAFVNELALGITCTVNSTDYLMAVTLDDVMLLDGGIRLAQKLFQTDMTITDFNNDDHVVSLADADAINLIQAGHFATQRQKRNDLKNQTETASLEQLLTINW